MDAKLTKSLTDLIDETLGELEELRKSRFEAAEISLKGPGDHEIGGEPANGKLAGQPTHKAEDDMEDDEEEKDEKDMDKGENESADPDAGHHKMDKGENQKADPDAGHHKMDKGENQKADPDAGHHVAKADDDKDEDDDQDEPHKDDPKHEAKEKAIAKKLMDMHKGEMKKSIEENESLMKSYVEQRVQPLEEKLSTILELVNKIAEQPVAPKGMTARATPLFKSEDAGGEPLHKAELASKLFELKKSGTRVDSLDIAKVEMGQDLGSISKKYQLS